MVKTSSPLTVGGPLSQPLIDKAKVIYSELIRCAPAQFDSRWDALLADWKTSGAQAVIDERRAKYPN
ncbi:MAG: hypothetical protein LBP81_06905 [Treponema sp.]|nr:hypothetical protein [Treponema sp.]